MAQSHKPKKKTKKRLAKGTVSQKWFFFKGMLKRAMKAGKIAINPAANLSPNGGRRARVPAGSLQESKTMTEEELMALLDFARHGLLLWAAVLFALMGLAGLRLGEARALQLSDLKLDHRHPTKGHAPRIWVRRTERQGILGPPKHGKERYVTVDPLLEQLLRIYVATLSGTIWLFPGRGPRKTGKVRANRDRSGVAPELGWCISERTVRTQWRNLLNAAEFGRQLSPKSLRHAFCTIALTNGESLEWVSREMGHRDVTVTQQVYGRWAQPRGLGTLVEWLATQCLPTRSYFGDPRAAALLAEHGISLDDLPTARSDE